VLKEPAGSSGINRVKTERLLQPIVFYDSANHRRRRHWNRVWKQCNGNRNRTGQANLDLALSKTVILNWPVENSRVQFRAEFLNALNHPQFANPDTNFISPTFGVVSSTAVNPRVGQLALKFMF
jgi:hypothetical protein